MFLLDTPIVLELRKAKSGRADPGLTQWATGVARQTLFLSTLSLLELENGVLQAAREDKAVGARLRTWIDDQVLRAFEGRMLPVDTAVVSRRAQIGLTDTRDALLAATAIEHGLTLVTRQTAAFKGARVKLFNPVGYRPEADDPDDGDWRQAGRSGPLWLKNLFVRA